jgi:hypothetical protein
MNPIPVTMPADIRPPSPMAPEISPNAHAPNEVAIGADAGLAAAMFALPSYNGPEQGSQTYTADVDPPWCIACCEFRHQRPDLSPLIEIE